MSNLNRDHLAAYPPASNPEARRFESEQAKLRLRYDNTPESWSLYEGRSLPTLWESNRGKERQSPEELNDIETLLVLQIQEIVSRTPPSEYPVVMVNVGGMWDQSSIRVGKFLNDRFGWIDSGVVTIVSTNLAFQLHQALGQLQRDPELYKRMIAGPDDTEIDWGNRKITPQELTFIQQNVHLIYSVQADASELGSVQIMLPNGKVFSLHRHIDVMTEANALMHSIQGESDFPALASCMRPPNGSMFLLSGRYEAKRGQGERANEYTELIRRGLMGIPMQGMQLVSEPSPVDGSKPEYFIYSYDPGLFQNKIGPELA